MTRRPPTPTLFPYTTLFRSRHSHRQSRHRRFERDRGKSRGRADFLQKCRRRGNRCGDFLDQFERRDRKSTRLNSSHSSISYAVFCLKKKKKEQLKDYSTTK